MSLELVTDRAGREEILAEPSVARRLVGTPINIDSPNNYWLRAVDGVALFAKRAHWEYCLIAPSFEASTPHNRRLLEWVFVNTDAMDLFFDSTNKTGSEFGAIPVGLGRKLTYDERGEIRAMPFCTWRLPIAAWLEKADEIRDEGGRIRRNLAQSGAAVAAIRDQDGLDRHLGYLSKVAAGDQWRKGVAGFNSWAAEHAVDTIRWPARDRVTELELLGVRVRIVNGQLEAAAGSA